MVNPYQARVDRREFLNLPGFHDGAYVVCYVEDTSERVATVKGGYYGRNPQPRMILEIADCDRRINLSFEIDSALNRKNSFHKIDTLIEVLQQFRQGLVEECVQVKHRAAELKDYDEAQEAKKAKQASPAQLDLLARYEEVEA